MSDLGTARGRIVVDPSGAVRGYGVAAKADQEFHNKAQRNARTFNKAGNVLIGAGATIAAGFGVAIKSAADFEERVDAIGAVSNASEAQLEKIRKKALQLGADTKFSAGEAASAMEELVKAGVPLADVMTGAADATVNLAAAGEVDLTKAAEIASAALNNFNLKGEDMAHVADLIAGSANVSAIGVEDFGLSLKQSGAVAATVGLSFDDLSLAITAMGNAGIKGSDAGTSLKTMLLNLNPSTAKQRDLMRELGIVTEDGSNRFFDAEGNVRSLAEIGGVLQDSLKGMTKQQQLATLEVLFGSDAIRAAAVIAKEGAGGLRELEGEMTKVSAADVAAKRMDNFKGSVEQLTGSLETLAIVVGTPFLKSLRGLVDGITNLVNKFTEMDEGTRNFILQALKWTGSVLLAAGALFKLVGALNAAPGGIAAFAKAMASPAGIVIIVIAALVALGFALFKLYQENETFRDAVQSAWRWIQDNIVPIIETIVLGVKAFGAALRGEGVTSDGFVGVMERLGVAVRAAAQWFTGTFIPAVGRFVGFVTGTVIPAIQRFAGEIQERLAAAFRWLQANVFPIFSEVGLLIASVVQRIVTVIRILLPVFRGVFQSIAVVVMAVVTNIRTILTNFVNAALQIWDLLGKHIISAVRIAFNLVKGFIEVILRTIRGIIQVVTGLIRGDWSRVWEGIKNIFGAQWDFIKLIVRTAVRVIQLIIRSFTSVVKAIWIAAWTVVRTIFQTTWNAIRAFIAGILAIIRGIIGGALNAIRAVIRTVLSAIRSVWHDVWGAISRTVRNIWGDIQSAVERGIGWVRRKIESVMETIRGIWNRIWGGMGNALSGIWDGIQNAVRRGVNLVIDVINWFIRLINRIPGVSINELSKVGNPRVARRSARSRASQAFGRKEGGFLTNGPRFVVGEGNPRYPEAVIATDPQYRRQNLQYWAWAGQQLGAFGRGGIPGYQIGGIISAVGGAVSAPFRAARDRIRDFVDDIKSATLRPLFGVAKRMVNALPVPGGWGEQIKNFAKGVLERMYRWAAGKADEDEQRRRQATGGPGSNEGWRGGGVEQWRGTALQALRLAGAPASWIGSLMRRMNQESGGNPRAVNRWDSNAARGTPSMGLMQTIGPTFNAYAGHLRGRGIFDPLANIYAAIRYTISRYGSGPAGWDRRGGYRDGAWSVGVHRGEMIVPNWNGLADMLRMAASLRRPMGAMPGGGRGNGQANNVTLSVTVNANTAAEGQAAGKAFLNVVEKSKILTHARIA